MHNARCTMHNQVWKPDCASCIVNCELITDFGGFRALAADNDCAGRGVGKTHALEVVVFNGGVGFAGYILDTRDVELDKRNHLVGHCAECVDAGIGCGA